MAKTYRVNEIFYSLQGEGFHTGTPAIFVRFSGCNLSCPFCDTDFASYTEMTAKEIAWQVQDYNDEQLFHGAPWISRNVLPVIIVLTGGEPAMQVDTELLTAIRDANYNTPIHIETNGTLPLPEGIDWITCSPKEGSKVVLEKADEVKVVFTERKMRRSDAVNRWLNAEKKVEPWCRSIYAKHYFLQPCSCANTEMVANYILAHPWWRLSLQTHKYLGIR